MNHTPTPWQVTGDRPPNPYWMTGKTIGAANPSDARRVADTVQDEDAAFIVRACNAHDELVAALWAVIQTWPDDSAYRQDHEQAICDARVLFDKLKPANGYQRTPQQEQEESR